MNRRITFISYSHDSDEHRAKVLALSERLRADGLETRLDRYVNGTPASGWPRWMLDQLDQADFVLVVCTEVYYRRFRGHEQPGKGRGVDWEGALVTQELYDARSATQKFVPILFASDQQPFIPEPLRGHTHYVLASEAAYQSLYDFLLGQAAVEPGAVGRLKIKPRRVGNVLTFGDDSASAAQRAEPAATPAAPVPTSPGSALALWREKLDYLQRAEVLAFDSAQKFALQHQIAEARAKIAELEAES